MFSPSIYEIKVSRKFTLADALYLPSWGVHVFPRDNKVLANIFYIGKTIDIVEDIIGDEIIINSWYRPPRYNTYIGSTAKKSWHIEGGALDFSAKNTNADLVRDKLKPYLLELGIRMEDLPSARWVHIDNKITKGKRFFRP